MPNESYFRTLSDFYTQVEEGSALGLDTEIQQPIENIVLAGMGGSAAPGDLLNSYVDLPIPFMICRDYQVPKLVKSRSLVFVVSYSGNTEESIAAFKSARRVNARIVAIASGGKLADLASKEHVPLIKVPTGIQPRAGVAYIFFPMLNILHSLKIIPDPSGDIRHTIAALKNPHYKDRAKILAEKLVDKVPLIYTSNRLKGVAYQWKINLNENAKTQAFYNVFPELNHNELVGFTKVHANYHVIILEDEFDEIRIKQRMKITKSLISKQGVDTTLISLSGQTLLSRMFSAIQMARLTSFYLAEAYGIDPEPVEMVEEFKSRLARQR